MLETAMRGARIQKVGQRQLVNVAKALKGAGVENLPFIRIEMHEDVDRISYFVLVLAHDYRSPPANTSIA
jgi:hypothetical protein